ncbi:hypothetical protein J416_01954 [Gracilibacillus halophilus YIM-C55.5]|uniref:DUF2922 domain-containing protein n=1 Tax=Gracilibacillus halophilus YIM-C55.5 TaxID=1308866 RepID=N4WFR7_9BACI|nr:DUF2922 domain-containing protein [Gracilibacillus halophilus]ENH98089.1 hypothetical protein J416_01954 [Gracilibacillus halophilus YIM-C55.5]
MKKIELKFENEEGHTVNVSLDDPVEPVDTAAVNEAMDTILAQNAFFSSGGELVGKKSARIVERNVTPIEL